MQSLIDSLLKSSELTFLMWPSIFLLGILTAVSSGCNIPILGAIAGYAGTSQSTKQRDTIIVAVSFMAGLIISLAVIGIVINIAGQVVGKYFAYYGKIIVGIVAIIFGLLALNLIPIKLPGFARPKKEKYRGVFGSIIFGFALGGSSMTCNIACCSPILPLLLGVSFLQGSYIKGAFVMIVYAVGYSLPLAAILYGISLGKWSLPAGKFTTVARYLGGVLLLAVGFYFILKV